MRPAQASGWALRLTTTLTEKMASHPFFSSALKIERAKHHIKDLDRSVHAFFARKPYKLIVRNNPPAGWRTYFVRSEKPLPAEFSLIIGDAVHNLRSALDLAMFQLIGHLSKSPQTVQFPFAYEAKKLENVIRSRQAHLAGEAVVAAIRALKPYPGGNELLAGVQALDVCDKHKLIIPVVETATLSGDEIGKIEPFSGASGPGRIVFGMRQGEDLLRVQIPVSSCPPSEHEANVQPSFIVRFGKGQPFAGLEAMPVLFRLVSEVMAAINALAAASSRDVC
jgi:hypothetical protein